MIKLLAVGIDKNFKTWSIPVEVEKVEDICVDDVSTKLYENEKSEKTLPTAIVLTHVKDGDLVQNSYRYIDDNWKSEQEEAAEAAETDEDVKKRADERLKKQFHEFQGD